MLLLSTYVSAKQNGALHESPDREMCSLFWNPQISVPNLHHVHVIMCVKVNMVEELYVCLHD